MDLDSVGSSSWLSDQVVLPETTELDTSIVDFGDDNDDIFFSNSLLNVAPSEDSFQLADCSSENLSAPGISRAKRGAEPNFCNRPSPAEGGQPGSAGGGMIDSQSLLRSNDI